MHATTPSTRSAPIPDTSVERPLRLTPVALVGGGGLMIAGAAIQQASGADVFALADTADRAALAGHLSDIAEQSTQLTIGLSFWVVGVWALTFGATLLARAGHGTFVDLARWAGAAAAGAATVFFPMMIGIAVGLAPAQVDGTDVTAMARTLAIAAVTADWFATSLVLAGSVGAAVLAGARTWAPTWLCRWAVLMFVLTVAALIGFAAGSTVLAMAEVPVGLGLCIAAGIVRMRSTSTTIETGAAR